MKCNQQVGDLQLGGGVTSDISTNSSLRIRLAIFVDRSAAGLKGPGLERVACVGFCVIAVRCGCREQL